MSGTRTEARSIIAWKSQDKADVIIGKNGITPGVLGEIKRRLKEQGVVKVKILKSGIRATSLGRREIAKKVADLTNSVLLEIRGRTFILYRPFDKKSGSSSSRVEGIKNLGSKRRRGGR